jgi:hypothetical protein
MHHTFDLARRMMLMFLNCQQPSRFAVDQIYQVLVANIVVLGVEMILIEAELPLCIFIMRTHKSDAVFFVLLGIHE